MEVLAHIQGDPEATSVDDEVNYICKPKEASGRRRNRLSAQRVGRVVRGTATVDAGSSGGVGNFWKLRSTAAT